MGTGLVFVYFNAVDEAGHVSGPDSDAINREVRLIDDAIGGFLDGNNQVKRKDNPDLTKFD